MEPVGGVIAEKVIGALTNKALDALFRRRLEDARAILLKELAKGKPWVIADDDAAAALFAYLRAAQEGAARLNLKLMAEAMVNAAQEATFAPDTFRRHSAKLADLSRDEVLLLASFARLNDHVGRGQDRTDAEAKVWVLLTNEGLPGKAEPSAVAAALSRTGWVVPASAFGGLIYYTTQQFEEVRRLLDLPAAASASDL